MEITGTFNRIIFRNEQSGYGSFLITIQKGHTKKSQLCKGYVPEYYHGMPIKLIGYIGEKDIFIVENIEENEDDETAIKEFILTSCKGVDKTVIRKVYKIFGKENILEKIIADDAYTKMTEAGISENITANIIDCVQNNVIEKRIFDCIRKFGGGYALANKLYKTYGKNAESIIQKNPYCIATITDNFFISDMIAKEYGLHEADYRRIVALVDAAFKKELDSGHTVTTFPRLYNKVNWINRNSQYPGTIPVEFVAYVLTYSEKYVVRDSYITSKKIEETEQMIAYHLKRLEINKRFLGVNSDSVEEIENELNIKYGDTQKKGFDFLNDSGVKIVTGGPGTGKTTTIKGFLYALKKKHPDFSILLAAPTGRAAGRLSESTGCKVTTIHKLLGIKPFESGDGIFTSKNESMQLEADCVVIDEMSMVDEELFYLLLKAIKSGTLLILVGDVNQLRSVGPGNVLHDLIDSDVFPCCVLDKTYRQEDGSTISVNADKIIKKQTDLVSADDFEILRADDEEALYSLAEKYAINYYDDNNVFYSQVISPVKQGKCGVYQLNSLLQGKINKNPSKLFYGFHQFKENDKIMMTKNNYEYDYMNGDIGKISDIDGKIFHANLNDTPYSLSKTCLEEMTLAYAATVHKCQGSEFPVIVIVLPKNPSCMLVNSLLYTAVTRGSKKVVVLSEKDALEQAILTEGEQRNTNLKVQIQQAFNEITLLAA